MNSDLHKYWVPITIGVIWSFFWKGWALWKAARKDDKAWYVVLLIVNSLGILEMFYIFIFSKRTTAAKSEDK